MKRFLRAGWVVLTSRAVTPVVIGIFLMIYIVLAFRSQEALVALMKLTGEDPLLIALLALIPLNRMARLIMETSTFMSRRKAMSGTLPAISPHALAEPAHERILPSSSAGVGEGVGEGAENFGRSLFDEVVRLPQATPPEGQESRLHSLGYRTRRAEGSLAAWRGFTAFPSRLLFLVASCALFLGILLSVTTRTSQRQPIVEGEPIPGGGALVERITLKEERGLLLARTLSCDVTLEGGAKQTFGLYPPARYRGFYVYPRYLGIAPLIQFSAPDLPRFESNFLLMLYPPGREDAAEIPGTQYRIMMTMEPGQGSDPFITGRMNINFRLLKGTQLVFAGSAPIGGEATGNGYRIAFPNFSRLVATDFVEDHGVVFIWAAGILFCLALLWWLPVRLFFPRQEMLFVSDGGQIVACCRAEGRRRAHLGSYHELLDALQPEHAGQ